MHVRRKSNHWTKNISGMVCTVRSQDIYHLNIPRKCERSVLESETANLGRYLVMKYIVKGKQLDLKEDDLPNAADLKGPSDLVKKIMKTKSDTVGSVATGATYKHVSVIGTSA